MAGYLLGFDIGSSSIKASLLESATGKLVVSATSPKTELTIKAVQPGWAEQAPDTWWNHMKEAVAEISATNGQELRNIEAVGISYQMHGLVVVGEDGKTLRDSIIWCDSRAVPYGEKAFADLGKKNCLSLLLNSPGNFTAAKLAWVKDHEPEIFKKIKKIMLPGDYLAYRMTGQMVTTPSGLSEGILWNASENRPASFLMDYFGFDESLLPEVRDSFGNSGTISTVAAEELGLPAGIPVSYRAGDQPNNAFSLNVLEPGELAATAGTSGVVYGIAGTPSYDPESRVNTFVHVNHRNDNDRYGVLLCLNGTGILNRWLKQNAVDNTFGSLSYAEINNLAGAAPAGSAGLKFFPFGNGAERTLGNKDIGASLEGLNFNIHERSHVLRAAQEGIVFALNYGVEIMKQMGMKIEKVKAGNANMFLSPLFRETFATVTGAAVELYSTDGAEGAARGAGVGAGVYSSFEEAFSTLEKKAVIEPDASCAGEYQDHYAVWKETLQKKLNQ